jgi:hypothetical protein
VKVGHGLQAFGLTNWVGSRESEQHTSERGATRSEVAAFGTISHWFVLNVA